MALVGLMCENSGLYPKLRLSPGCEFVHPTSCVGMEGEPQTPSTVSPEISPPEGHGRGPHYPKRVSFRLSSAPPNPLRAPRRPIRK
jgi:hypothetical protein